MTPDPALPSQDHTTGFNMPPRRSKVIKPLTPGISSPSASTPAVTDDPAVSMLRQKITQLYATEPDAREELQEAKDPSQPHSKHQAFMLQLSSSGKSLADIQTEWHNYYINLPDHEKHKVWQEFYSHHPQTVTPVASHVVSQPVEQPAPELKKSTALTKLTDSVKDNRTIAEVKEKILSQVKKRSNPAKPSGLKSLAFGLGMGAIVAVLMLFGFFNERFIAPFLTPSRTVSSTPLIIDPNTASIGPEPKIIVPKINVEIPVVYDEPSIAEADIQQALEGGVVHYSITSKPGELGNGAIFGHSSNNILNRGKYKFAFVLLKQLEPGDTFMVHKDGRRYVYKVFEKKIVPPTDLSVLDPVEGRPATMSLITCDPPGTSLNRLVVIGEQISPDPAANVASTADKQEIAQPSQLPSDAPTLWQRLTGLLAS